MRGPVAIWVASGVIAALSWFGVYHAAQVDDAPMLLACMFIGGHALAIFLVASAVVALLALVRL